MESQMNKPNTLLPCLAPRPHAARTAALPRVMRFTIGLTVLALSWPEISLAAQAPDGYQTGRVGKIFTDERAEGAVGPQPPSAEDGGVPSAARPAYGSVVRVVIAGDAQTYIGLLNGAAYDDRAGQCLSPGSSVRFRIDSGRMRIQCADGAELEFPAREAKDVPPGSASKRSPK